MLASVRVVPQCRFGDGRFLSTGSPANPRLQNPEEVSSVGPAEVI